MKKEKYSKYSRFLMIAGSIMLVISIVCFIGLLIALKGRISISELNSKIKSPVTRTMAEMSMQSVPEYLGFTDVGFFLIRFAMTSRTLFLILGILVLGGGVALYILGGNNPDILNKVKRFFESILAVRNGNDKGETVKCPKCGKVHSSKISFCPNCGEKLPEYIPPTPPASGKVVAKCSGCGKEFSEKISYCTDCGAKVIEVSTELCCPVCGAKNPAGAKFCCACAASLTGGMRGGSGKTPPLGTPPELVFRSHPDSMHTSEESAPSAEPEKKNPFMKKTDL